MAAAPRRSLAVVSQQVSKDSASQLEEVFTKLAMADDVTSRHIHDEFRELRILVIGRAGSGKSTLLKLILGNTSGPKVSKGREGVQDINREWRHPDRDLPLIIHDSNGIGINGQQHRDDVERFLYKHQVSPTKPLLPEPSDARRRSLVTEVPERIESFMNKQKTLSRVRRSDTAVNQVGVAFRQRVHMVWYVFSATDERFLSDGGLLDVVANYDDGACGTLPLLLVMTHVDKQDTDVTDADIDELLKVVRDDGKRRKLKENLVRTGSKVKAERDGSLTVSGRDDVGLQDLINKTKAMVEPERVNTWVACQVIDTNAKLEASAQAMMTTSLMMNSLFVGVKLLYEIWGVPKPIRQVLMGIYLREDNSQKTFLDFFAKLLESFVVPPLTASFLTLGVILYAKVRQHPQDIWNVDVTPKLFSKYCKEFCRSPYGNKMLNFSRKYGHFWKNFMNTDKQVEKLKNDLIQFLKELQNVQIKYLTSQEAKVSEEDKYYYEGEESYHGEESYGGEESYDGEESYGGEEYHERKEGKEGEEGKEGHEGNEEHKGKEGQKGKKGEEGEQEHRYYHGFFI